MERERRRRTMGDDRCLCVMSKWLQKKMEGEKRGVRREREVSGKIGRAHV